jgi:hypothetical protein
MLIFSNKIPDDVGLNGSRAVNVLPSQEKKEKKKKKKGEKIFSYLLSVEVDGVVVVS